MVVLLIEFFANKKGILKKNTLPVVNEFANYLK